MDRRSRRTLISYSLLGPYISVFFLFWAFPILQSIWFTFQNWRISPPTIDLAYNWGRLVSDPLFKGALLHTLALLTIQVPVMILLAVQLAVLLNVRSLRFSGFFRFAFFAPVVVSEVAYSAIFRLLFDGNFGAVNIALMALGLPPADWLHSQIGAVAVLVLAVTWRWTGYNVMILLVGLRTVPECLYEAARLDGVSPFRQFFHITLPHLRPVIAFAVVMSVLGSLQLFVEPQLITRSGPAGATATVGTYLYLQAFQDFNFGYAATVGYCGAIVALVVSFILMGIFRSLK